MPTIKFIAPGLLVLYSAMMAAYCMLVFGFNYLFLSWIFRDQAL